MANAGVCVLRHKKVRTVEYVLILVTTVTHNSYLDTLEHDTVPQIPYDERLQQTGPPLYFGKIIHHYPSISTGGLKEAVSSRGLQDDQTKHHWAFSPRVIWIISPTRENWGSLNTVTSHNSERRFAYEHVEWDRIGFRHLTATWRWSRWNVTGVQNTTAYAFILWDNLLSPISIFAYTNIFHVFSDSDGYEQF